MPIAYRIDQEKKLIHETWTGEVHAAELAAYWKRYLADPEVLKIRRTIVDLRTCVIAFRGTDFDGLIQTIVLPALEGRKWTTAIVVARPLQFGVSRQYQVFADRYSRDSIFASMADAEKWIAATDSGSR
jgi:hypothetical protein